MVCSTAIFDGKKVSDPLYIPMNMRFDGKGAAAELAHWKALAEQDARA
jgi:hypothetical protein